MKVGQDSLSTQSQLNVEGKTYHYYSLIEAEKKHFKGISRLPYSLKVLFENLLRFEDGTTVTVDDIKALSQWTTTQTSEHEIAYRPARVLMQDFTGVPAVVDLAAMRTAIQKLGGNADSISPLSPVDLVIDHSIMVIQALKCIEIWNAMNFYVGDKKPLPISKSYHLAPVFVIKSIWNILVKRYGLAMKTALIMPIQIPWSVQTHIPP